MKQNKFLGVLALALSLALVACGGGKGGEASEEGGSSGSSKCKHDYGEWQVVTPATCEDAGSSKQVCKLCGNEKTRTDKALGHDWQEQIIRAANCTTDGLENRTCKRAGCGKTENDVVIPKLNHKFDGQLIEDTPASIGVAGEGHYVCQNENCPGDGEHTPAWQVEEIPALVPSVTISKAALVKDSAGDVYLKLEGSEQYYDEVPEQFKWAFGLLENSAPRNQWGQQQGQPRYVVGKAADALTQADYTFDAELDTTNKTFTISFKVTDIVPNTGVPYKGLFRVYAGPYLADNSNYKTLSVSVSNAEGTNTADKNYYNFYWRNDQETGNVLTLGVMPATAPFKWETAVATYVEGEGDEPAHTYVEIGGEYLGDEATVEAAQAALDAVYKVTETEGTAPVEGVHWTQAEIDAAQEGDPAYGKTTDDWKTAPVEGVDPVVRPVFIQFQSEGNSYYGPTGHSGSNARDPEATPITYEVIAKQVGTKICAYVKIDVSFMGSVDATVFNTHMNLLEKSQENCVLPQFGVGDDGAINATPVALPGGTMELVIFSNPNGANTASNAYGNLAFKVQAKTAAAE